MGSRWNPQKPHFCKLVMRQYNTFSENYVRAFEIFREIYWESKRAPTIMHTMLVNPYRREKLIKKFFGKTAEERREMRAKLRKANKEYQAHIDNKTMQEELALADSLQKRSAKRRGYAEKRAKLGFNDGTEEVDDPVLDQLALDEAKYQKDLKDKRERKPIKMAATVEGISKDEYFKEMLKEHEKFVPK
jgi:hypothetical protein